MLLLSVIPISTQAAGSGNRLACTGMLENGETVPLTSPYTPEIRFFRNTRDHTINRTYYLNYNRVNFNVADIDKSIYIDLYLADFFENKYENEVVVGFCFFVNNVQKTIYVNKVSYPSNYSGSNETYEWYRFKLSSSKLVDTFFSAGVYEVVFYGISIVVYPKHVINFLSVDSNSNGGAYVGGVYIEKDFSQIIDEESFEIPSFTDNEDRKWYSGFVEIIAKIYTKILGFFYDFFSWLLEILTDFLEPLIYSISEVFQECFDVFKPYLKNLFDNSLLPLIQQILDSISRLVTAVVDAFSPLLADIVNFFAPYFSEIITMITSEIADLVNTLNPLVQEFVAAINPSLESLVTSLVDGITEVVEALFVPTETSAEDFEYFKTQLKEKVPIFDQLKSFLSVLFNPLSYEYFQI